MPEIKLIAAADSAALAPFDMIIDVRSPAEFAEDHVPGAVNLPVLSNEERARVGTIYVQDSPFRARRLGAALVARNVALHLETALADRDGAFQPLIYCWRGGQRSGAMAAILSQVGWRTALLSGGYRTYRRHVTARLYDETADLNLVLLDGRTGSAKTEILGRLTARGLQTLDLEALAGHRGSVFGGIGRAQPAQKMFESRLLAALSLLDPARPIVVEAEASKVGDRMVPPLLWRAMTGAPSIILKAPTTQRARYLARRYGDAIADRAAFDAALARLPVYPGRKALAAFHALADAGDLVGLALELIQTHYDPAYDRAIAKTGRPGFATIDMAGLDDADQEAAADRILALVRGADVARPQACG